MKNSKTKNAIAWVLTVAIAITSTFFVTKSIYGNKCNDAQESAYEIAVDDALKADKDEVQQLVNVTKDSPMITWSKDGKKVLLLTWHKYPESYPDGSDFECKYGAVWTFTDKEILSWYQSLDEDVTDWDLRFKQLLGLTEEKEYTHFTALWVDTDEMIRPAYQPDITKQITEKDLDGSSLGDNKEWFDGNIVWSYFDSSSPWTRLGYTYDWNESSDEYGLSEFLILPDSKVEVEWTVTNDEFIQMLKSGSLTK